MTDLERIEYLRGKLSNRRTRVDLRYKYYNQKYTPIDFGKSTPKQFYNYHSRVGWCTKAVDSLANRLVFRKFEDDSFNFNEIFRMNNADVLFDSAIRSALISSCSFIYISLDDEGYPRLQVIDGGNATGIIDPQTSMLKYGYAILETDEFGKPTVEAYFTPDYTAYYHGNTEMQVVDNPAKYPLLVPIIYRPSDKRPFGHSRISRVCMEICQKASRTTKRAEISAEFYSVPQKYVVGLSEDVDFSSDDANMSAFLAIYKDEDGDKPNIGQFSQQSMAPYLDQMAELVKEFCGETGLTSDDLGFISSNPSSAEAIKASHDELRLLARQAQRNFGVGFINVGYLAASLRDNLPYERKQIYQTKCVWAPIFEPDASMLSSIGDGVNKLNQAIPDYLTEQEMDKLTGVDRD